MAGVITVNLPVFLIILPLVAAFILPTIGRRQRLQENLLLVVGSLGILGQDIWPIWSWMAVYRLSIRWGAGLLPGV